jgi:hypothetical protein
MMAGRLGKDDPAKGSHRLTTMAAFCSSGRAHDSDAGKNVAVCIDGDRPDGKGPWPDDAGVPYMLVCPI